MRGKWDHGSVKTIRADSKTPCLDLGLFLESARGYSFPREKNSLSHPRTHRLPTHLPSKRTPPLRRWDGFWWVEPLFKLCKVKAGQFQRDFFSVPPTYARVRGKGDHGSVKTCQADSNALGLDLRAFLGGVGGHSLARQRMVPHVHAPIGFPRNYPPNGTPPRKRLPFAPTNIAPRTHRLGVQPPAKRTPFKHRHRQAPPGGGHNLPPASGPERGDSPPFSAAGSTPPSPRGRRGAGPATAPRRRGRRPPAN